MRPIRSWVDRPLELGATIELPRTIAHHLYHVLRLRAGASIVLFNGQDGRDYQARLIHIGKQSAQALIEQQGEQEPPSRLSIHLALGISRGERMDFALQKAVELGVEAITPLFTQRTQVKLQGERLEKKMRHWHAIVVSACEQSGRRRLPKLHSAQKLTHWLKTPPSPCLLLDPRASNPLPAHPPLENRLVFLIGPEGGLSPKEHAIAYANGCHGICLGPRILRTETAPLAAISAAQVLWGDFSAPCQN